MTKLPDVSFLEIFPTAQILFSSIIATSCNTLLPPSPNVNVCQVNSWLVVSNPSSSGGVGESLQSRLRNKKHARMPAEHNAIFMYYPERYKLIVVEALFQWAV
jgi:hypothetical protein